MFSDPVGWSYGKHEGHQTVHTQQGTRVPGGLTARGQGRVGLGWPNLTLEPWLYAPMNGLLWQAWGTLL